MNNDPNAIQDTLVQLHWANLLESMLVSQGVPGRLLWGPGDPMYVQDILGVPPKRMVRPRYMKAQAEQKQRTRGRAEVFTPPKIVTQMNDALIEYNPELTDWRNYVRSTFCEITCGEAPFLTTRYHAGTGEPIHIDERTGVLDRKLALIREHADELDLPERSSITHMAMTSCYGYEYQGDSLLIARVNLLLTWADHWMRLFDRAPTLQGTMAVISAITTNLVQMGGLTGCVPGTDFRVEFTDWRDLHGHRAEPKEETA